LLLPFFSYKQSAMLDYHLVHFHRLVDSAGATLHHPSVIHTGVSIDNEMARLCSVVLRPLKVKVL